MAGDLVNHVKQFIFDAIYRAIPFDFGSPLSIGLSITVPNYDGTNFTEPSATNGYNRLEVQSAGWHIPDEFGESSNNVVFTFPTATGEWGYILYAGVFEAAVPGKQSRAARTNKVGAVGDLLAYHALSEPVYVSTGITVEFEVGDFKFGPWITS